MSDDRLFLQDADYYKRNINPLGHYIEQTALYLSKSTGDSYDVCFDYVSKQVRERNFPGMVDPEVDYFLRVDCADKHVETIPLSKYIYSALAEDLIIAPTFTCYVSPKKKLSKLSGFVKQNTARRSAAKKQAFKYKAEGNTMAFTMKNNEQANMKNYNNSMSGAFGSAGSVLFNPTAHSTLTSTIRSVSSFGNASNERIVMGNRHYYHPDIVLFNMITCCQLTDTGSMQDALDRYSLYIPTVDDVMSCIEWSSRFYGSDPKSTQRLKDFASKMTDIERASFVYSGDLYHIRKHNESFMRSWIDQISAKCSEPVENAIELAGKIDEQIMNYAHQICFSEVQGHGKDYKKMADLGVLDTLVSTALNITRVVKEYQPFIRTFFLSKLIPASHAYIREMMRRSVVLSDTDSTCFSVDDWMLWYFGGLHISERTYGVCGAVAFIANQSIAHNLALLSANINVIDGKLHALAMKNEFLWSVHMPTNVAKHYVARTVMQEGNVFPKSEMEIKGVHMKNSAAPPTLIKQAHLHMEDILARVDSNQHIDLAAFVKTVRDVEQNIISSISRGETTYLKSSKIKEAEAYSLPPTESTYQHYTMWKDVFSPKYGSIDPPPYSVVKIPTMLDNKTKLNNWVGSIEDVELRYRMAKWLGDFKKTTLATFYISTTYANSYGIPKEILQALDVRKIVLDLTLVYRIVLESLGYFVKDGWLVSDV